MFFYLKQAVCGKNALLWEYHLIYVTEFEHASGLYVHTYYIRIEKYAMEIIIVFVVLEEQASLNIRKTVKRRTLSKLIRFAREQHGPLEF